MGLSWQQAPLAPGAIGRFLVPDPLPERLLYAERLRRRMRVRFGGTWIANSEDVVLLHESGRYPVAYFPLSGIAGGVLEASQHTTRQRDLGATSCVNESALTPVEGQTFCPYKGLCSHYDIGDAHQAAWCYLQAWPEVGRVVGFISFEPDKIEICLDGTRLRLEPDQTVVAHGVDRDLTLDEAPRRAPATPSAPLRRQRPPRTETAGCRCCCR
jgi:uncharacterized protein (DUF427 family)